MATAIPVNIQGTKKQGFYLLEASSKIRLQKTSSELIYENLDITGLARLGTRVTETVRTTVGLVFSDKMLNENGVETEPSKPPFELYVYRLIAISDGTSFVSSSLEPIWHLCAPVLDFEKIAHWNGDGISKKNTKSPKGVDFVFFDSISLGQLCSAANNMTVQSGKKESLIPEAIIFSGAKVGYHGFAQFSHTENTREVPFHDEYPTLKAEVQLAENVDPNSENQALLHLVPAVAIGVPCPIMWGQIKSTSSFWKGSTVDQLACTYFYLMKGKPYKPW